MDRNYAATSEDALLNSGSILDFIEDKASGFLFAVHVLVLLLASVLKLFIALLDSSTFLRQFAVF